MLVSLNKICTVWVLGHIGFEDNATVDELVRKGAGMLLHVPVRFYGAGNGSAEGNALGELTMNNSLR